MSVRSNDLPPIDFAALAGALLERAYTLVPLWLRDGQIVGHEYICGGLDGGEGRSLSVNLKTGKWAEFAGDERGNDLLSLYAAIYDLPQGQAARQVAIETGLESVAGIVKVDGMAAPLAPPPRPAPAPVQQKPKEVWSTLRPVPALASEPSFSHFSRDPRDLIHRAAYRVGNDLHGFVVRFRTSDGGKDTLPYTFCQSDFDSSMKWQWKQWDEPRPLFLPSNALPGERTVIAVEGEIKAEVLQRTLDATAPGLYCVVSWPGGCKVWSKADWSWLAGSTVLLWPDCDAKRERLTANERKQAKDDEALGDALQAAKPLLPEHKQPGMAAMLGIGGVLRDVHGCTVSMLAIPSPGEKPDGWDARDAIEVDGWTGEDVLLFLSRAQMLVKAPSEEVKGAAGEKIAASVGTGGGDDGGAEEPVDAADSGDIPWWLRPYWDIEKGRWNLSRKTVIAALEHDDALKGVVAFNELTSCIQCRKAWPWPHAKAGDVRSADSLLLGNYLTKKYKLPSIPKASLEEAIQTVANTQRWHPIREWLTSLKWDQKPRLDKWLVHVLGETPESITPATMEYLGLVGRYWLQGMVWRVMEPGCKFDYCPVLEGAGGLRKSTLVEVLASAGYFADTPFDMSRGKEAQEQVQGVWLYEIAELAALSKADVNAIKAFISSRVDRYRAAYAATVEAYARQCVLVGTTNEDTYLKDRTGNRRWWPVPVRHQINTEWVQRWREQLFAEAFALYLQGVSYTPTGDQERRLFQPMQESRLVETAVESQLMAVLTRSPGATGIFEAVHVDAEFLTIAQLVTALGVDAAKSTPGLETQIRGWLKQMGWGKDKKQIKGVRANGYTRPKQWPPKDAPNGLDEPAINPAPDAAVSGEPFSTADVSRIYGVDDAF